MVKNIVIVGGGSAGWLTAAHMSHNLKDINISLVESPDHPTIGVGESTVPPVVDFLKNLGLEEKDWMPACNATYKSSICFRGFHDTDKNKIWYPFSRSWNVNSIPANQFWMNKYLTDDNFNDRFSIYDYTSLVPEICEAGKTVKSLPNSSYAYHFDATALGEFLKNFAKNKGVNHIADTVTEIIQNEDGSIKELNLKDGAPVQADLFVDCSGFKSMFIGEVFNEPFDDYYDSLFNDSAIAIRFPFEDKEKEMVSYTLCTALSAGWVWTIPLYNRLGTGYVYSSKYKTKEEAEQEFRTYLTGVMGEKRVAEAQAKHIPIKVGKYKRTWIKNCVAIGLSSGFIEPLESTGIQIVQGEVDLLTRIIGSKNDYNCADVAVFNSGVTSLMDNIRDFLICHYALTSREDTPYWHDVKYNTHIPDSLTKKLVMARASIPSTNNEAAYDTGTLAGFSFSEGWYLILAGMGHLPFDYDQFRQARSGPHDQNIVNNMNTANNMMNQLTGQKKNIKTMPSHYQYLKDNIFDGLE